MKPGCAPQKFRPATEFLKIAAVTLLQREVLRTECCGPQQQGRMKFLRTTGSLEEAFGSDGSHKMRAIPETALSNPSEPSPFVYRLCEQLKI
jgi:hypothetical protein